MNDVVATNIRILRDYKAWTQEHLAEVAGVTHRTVQRAEGAEGISADTLMALAAAFDLPVEALRTDWVARMARECGVEPGQLTPEVLERRQREAQTELESKYRMIPVKRVTSPSDFDVLDNSYATNVGVISGSEEARDVAAEFEAFMIDLMDIVPDVEAPQRRQYQKDAFDFVRRLEALGCVVSVGKESPSLKFFDGSMPAKPFPIGYVVIAKADDAKAFVAVERGPVQFRF